MLEEHWTIADAADAAGVSERTAYRWVRRWRDGDRDLLDRSSAPKRTAVRTPARVERLIEQLRRTRVSAPKIAAKLEMAVSTVCAVLARLGLNRLSRLGPPEPPNRFVRRRPGELVHLDVKKLARFLRPGHRVMGRDAPGMRAQIRQGWEFVHVAVDDYSRVAYVEILPDETALTTIGFLERAASWFAIYGVRVREILTDNGSNYIAHDFARACQRLRIKHIRTRRHRPPPHERQSRTVHPNAAARWAYAAVYRTSNHRARTLPRWVRFYNQRRRHGSLGHQPPESRLPTAA